ncbi:MULTISPECIES: GNAT family N-acetyltransferase [unclassified Brevundimonas]|uniref:GNAT family N-acetyltransferase n=1 Tax=unclassified Brevundimonas TaxID=2622653 RepID=UPI0006F610B4|nr:MULTISPECIES: GNAT family N-acetyltransferase [unclassified Brevundimonas]KQY70126.1 acetyltransferase [Brevundimonas sp. Root1423]KRA28834.1 acetyltransferase [Brevundimonas sp. Root608]
MTTLVTERLTLTPVAVSDLEDLVTLWADPAFATAIFPAPLNSEDVWFRLLRDIGHWEALGYGNWAIRETSTGAYVGSVGVLDFHRILTPAFDAPELGWGVAPRFQGRGFAFEALSAALAWCDDALNAPRTVCMISPDNAPSHALAKRAGYAPYVETTYKGAPVVLLERLAQ